MKPVYVMAQSYGSEGIEPWFKCKGVSCVSGSGSSLCGGYYGVSSAREENGKTMYIVGCVLPEYHNDLQQEEEQTYHLEEFIMPKHFIDEVIEKGSKKNDLILKGVYLEPAVANILDRLGKKGGKGTRSEIANEALKRMFKEKALL